LILIVELKPFIKFSFDPVGMVSELAGHKFWHDKLDADRPGSH